jgi:hypothetical protein
MDLSPGVNAAGIGQLLAAMRLKGLFSGDHKFIFDQWAMNNVLQLNPGTMIREAAHND